jgi:predicted metal-dependent hydrolase
LPSVAVLVTDLFFAVPIGEAVRAAGARAQLVNDATELAQAIDSWPALVIIDLTAPGDWQAVVRRDKTLPQTRTIPIVAFGSHVQTGALQAARAAGCDHAWARSRFVGELPQLLQQTLHPDTRWPAGWDEPPPPALLQGIAEFNSGRYWECHETLEALWRAEPRPVRELYQGILQIGVGFHHLRERNRAGTLKCLRRGLPRLRSLPPVCQGVSLPGLRDAALRIHDRVAAIADEDMSGFDLSTLPRIELSAVGYPESP